LIEIQLTGSENKSAASASMRELVINLVVFIQQSDPDIIRAYEN